MMDMIEKLNDLIAACPAIGDADEPRYPVLFIVGLPRSGSTVMTQILIHRMKLGYVTNLVARFWMAPEYGIAITRSVSDDPGSQPPELSSSHGQTDHYEGHHEFGYFWKRWFKYRTSHYIDPRYWNEIEDRTLLSSLARMEAAWERPLIFKNPPALSLQIALLNRIVPNALFLNLIRSDADVATSLYHARQAYCGTHEAWFSIKPPQYNEIVRGSVVDQIAGQVFCTRCEIERQLAGVEVDRQLTISYEDLCADADKSLTLIEDWLQRFEGFECREERSIPSIRLRRR